MLPCDVGRSLHKVEAARKAEHAGAAFEFLPPAHSAGQHGSHGDVVFWPLLAVGDYL